MISERLSILFIHGINEDVSERDLYEELNDFPILYIKLPKDQKTSKALGYGFLGFKNPLDAEKVFKKLNYRKFHKKTLRVTWYNKNRINPKENPEFNVFIKNIHKSISHDEFDKEFSKHGTILSARIVEDEDGENMGYGFVLYDNINSPDTAINELNGKNWNGKNLYVGKYLKNKPKINTFNNVYIKNIPIDFPNERILEFFSKYGEISSSLIKTTDQRELPILPSEKKNYILSHKYAFMCYKEFDTANKVVNTVPFFKLSDELYNENVKKLSALLKERNVQEKHIFRGAVYIIENCENFKDFFEENEKFSSVVENFLKLMKENEEFYIIKDKSDRFECYRALKKKERATKAKDVFEKSKKSLQEKYKFCNLYVKNLNLEIDDQKFYSIFSDFGQIKSYKIFRKFFNNSFLSIKPELWVIGYICYHNTYDAHKAKLNLNGNTNISKKGLKLYVDFHQTKRQRTLYHRFRIFNLQSNVQNKRGILSDYNKIENTNVLSNHKTDEFLKLIQMKNNGFKNSENIFPAFKIDNTKPLQIPYIRIPCPSIKNYINNTSTIMQLNPNQNNFTEYRQVLSPNNHFNQISLLNNKIKRQELEKENSNEIIQVENSKMKLAESINDVHSQKAKESLNFKSEFIKERIISKLMNMNIYAKCSKMFPTIAEKICYLDSEYIYRLLLDNELFNYQVKTIIDILSRK